MHVGQFWFQETQVKASFLMDKLQDMQSQEVTTRKLGTGA